MAWEPAFGQDLEWTLLHALGCLGKSGGGESGYFRLSTRPVDQALAALPEQTRARQRRRRGAISGGYRLRDSVERGLKPVVTLVGVGAMMPEVIRAAELLEEEGAIGADVVCLTSPDLVFRAWRARQGLGEGKYGILDELFPPEQALPIVSVMDGQPHALSFLGSIVTAPAACLGVIEFGQSGDVESLYEHHGIDVETIIGAVLDVTGRTGVPLTQKSVEPLLEANVRFVGRDYRQHLRTAVGSSAAPYGYTLATWTTGAVITHAYGLPTTIDALLFMCGAVLAFAVVGAVAFGGVTTRFAHTPRQAPLWGSFHLLSVGGAIGAAALVTYLLSSRGGWLLAPFASTVTYLLILGTQVSAAHERERGIREDH